MLLTYKNEITILYSGECRNTYFEMKRSGGNDEQNKGLSKVTSFTIHHVYSYREVPMFSLSLLNIVLNISRCVSLEVVFDFSSFLFFKFG